MSRLAERLSAARRDRFIGRSAELALFQSALSADELPFNLLFVHGPGGVGKTSLLGQFSQLARQAGVAVWRLDARNLEPTPAAFQAGLAWATVLRKRAALRAAFLNFEPAKVAALTDQDVARLKADPGLIRHEAKIRATISNAAATLALREEGGLVELVNSFAAPPDSGPADAARQHRTRSPESEGLAAALRERGFRFVGPTNMYALLQAVGLAPH